MNEREQSGEDDTGGVGGRRDKHDASTVLTYEIVKKF